jgi:hypothetical protein
MRTYAAFVTIYLTLDLFITDWLEIAAQPKLLIGFLNMLTKRYKLTNSFAWLSSTTLPDMKYIAPIMNLSLALLYLFNDPIMSLSPALPHLKNPTKFYGGLST